jgi:hypothetical protein
MAEPYITSTQAISDLASIGGSVSDPSIQRFATGLYQNASDKEYATYELSEYKSLPKSLFYDAGTAHGAYNGLFAYYVLGKGRGVKYHNSESVEGNSVITPIESRNPTARMIIEVTSRRGADGVPAYLDSNNSFRGQVYNVKDFIFCKHYGIIPNNRMLTLRRFPHPTLDSLRILPDVSIGIKLDSSNPNSVSSEKVSVPDLDRLKDKFGKENSTLPVCQAVTYFGEGTGNNLNAILGISTGLMFSYETQESLKNEKTGDPGLMNSPFGDLIKSFIMTGDSKIDPDAADKIVGTLLSPEKNLNRLRRFLLDSATTSDGPLSKKIFVNVNTVNQIMTRKQGFSGGAEGSAFTLNFEYNLTSVGAVNSKLLFLDLITNLLSLGSDYGQFLSPELRLEQTNVGIGFPGGAAGYAKSIVDPLGYIRDQVSGVLSSQNVNALATAETSVKKDIEEASNEIKNFINDPSKGIPKDGHFYKSIAVMLSDAFLKKIYYQPIMLSGYPTGEWHLVVGNPLNPIAMMGNLVCTNVKISLNDDLGPDDFPTEIKASFTLSPGRQRHRGDWESMFNRGNGRLYLGQLTTSGESTNAFVNQSGDQVNNPANIGINNVTVQSAATTN